MQTKIDNLFYIPVRHTQEGFHVNYNLERDRQKQFALGP